MPDMIPIYGETDGSSTTGTFDLDSEWFENAVSSIKIDKGLSAKLWIFEIAGKAVDVIVQYSTDGGLSWSTLKRISLPSDGSIDIDHRKPIIVTAKNDDTYIRLTWSQSTAGVSGVSGVIEFDNAR